MATQELEQKVPAQGFSESPQQQYDTLSPGGIVVRKPVANGLSLSDIFAKLWQYRGVVIITLIVGMLLTVSAVMAYAWRSTSQVYNYAIRFNFTGLENGQYPNGQTFDLKDILAPKLISNVYASTIGDDSDVTQSDFAEAFSISSYTPSRQSIIDKYQKLLADRRLTFAETTELQATLEAELNAAARRAAILSFDNDDLGLDQQNVETALRSIVDEWNTYSIDTRGVLRLELSSIDPRSIVSDRFSGLPHVDKVRALGTIFSNVTAQIAGLENYAGAQQLLDQKTGATINSMKREMAILGDQIVNFSRELPSASSAGSRVLPQMLTPGAFDSEAVRDVDLQIGFDILQARLSDIRSNIKIIRDVAAGDSVADLKTGLTISDLENIISELELYHIDPVRSSALESGLSEKPEEVRTYFEMRIRQLERKKASIEAIAATLASVGDRYDKTSIAAAAGGENSDSQSSQTPIFPQIGDGFLDRIIDMAGRSEDANFRQDLATRSISLLSEASEVQTSISALRDDLATFNAGLRPGLTADAGKISEYRKRLNNLLEQLRDYLAVTARIGARIQSSEEVIAILQGKMGLPETDPRTSLRRFPSASSAVEDILPIVVDRLQGLIATTNQFRERLAPSLYGAQALSVSISTPERVKSRLVTRETVLIFAMGLFLTLIFVLLLPLILSARRNTEN